MAIDQGIRLSDERTRKLMKRLENVYADAYKTAIENNEKALIKFSSFKDSDFPNLTPEQIKDKREAYIKEVNRTRALSKNIAAEIASAGETAAKIIQGEMSGIYGLNYDFAAFDIQKQADLNFSFAQLDRNQIAAIVSGEKPPFSQVGYIERKDTKTHKRYLDRAYGQLGDDTVMVRRLQDQLIQGVMNGESQQKIMRRIKGVTGMETRQAKRIVQTERTRVQSMGRNQAIHEAAEMGIGMQKQWIARLHNTRDSHLKNHLEIINEGEKFNNGLQFPGDPSGGAAEVVNCFCLIKPMVKSVSPALKRHREKFGQKSFEEYRKR